MADQKLLRIENLKLYFRTQAGPVQAVDDVNFDLDYNRAVVILGESGCGKTSLAKAILRLLPRNLGEYSGKIYLDGTDVMAFDDETYRRNVRWVKMSLVPQAAMNALNPVIRVGEQVAEPAILHMGMGKDEALGTARKMFQNVGVPADFLVAIAPEKLAGPGYVLDAGEAVIVLLGLFPEGCPCHSQPRVFCKSVQKKGDVISIEGNIGVQVADDVVIQIPDPVVSRIESMHLAGKVTLAALGHSHQFDPWMSRRVLFHNVVGAVGGAVANDHPLQRKQGLSGDGLYRLLDELCLVAGGSYQDVSEVSTLTCILFG